MLTRSLHHPDYIILVKLLRNIRKTKGLTQKDLATLLGVKQSLISKIEKHERRVDLVELRLICQVMGISIQEFVALYEQELLSLKDTRK